MVSRTNGHHLVKTVTLKVLGREYTFKNETDDSEAPDVAAYFEDAVRKVKTQFLNKKIHVDKETVLILAGLNIASDLYKEKKRQHQLINRMNQSTLSVLNALEKAAC
jgi:cell division protein ZapA (FtsZ GTPase activity inhibitor)